MALSGVEAVAFRPGALVNFPLAENPFGVPIADALWALLFVLTVLMVLGVAAFAACATRMALAMRDEVREVVRGWRKCAHTLVEDLVHAEALPPVQLKGFQRPTPVYSVVGLRAEVAS